MCTKDDRFTLQFNNMEHRKFVLDGTWFCGRSLFTMASYDDMCVMSQVLILTFTVWIEIFGLLPAQMTEEATKMVGATLDVVGEVDKTDIKSKL
ncbi:hypothetical protein ACLB2K_069133 [Fragaria x ananassa]